ncbi:hypothetical protein M2164_005932 [Streptomyces sp. SAI-208]|uniref:hypothetical protein n=1 Tax=Streptomyces sp. SAI-208 TaxID=2940550 RepID=UPI00247549B4|nr:hypothetical protein [Streptomyces sp. SAI-208]MDH6610297.1 hypothetical protein [Streptomyces sp. SAI-208]
MSRIELSPEQFHDMRHALDQRERAIIEHVLQQPDYPPLPPCPECGAAVEQMDSMVEPPQFAVDEQAFLINVKPCGHKFRAVIDLDEPM